MKKEERKLLFCLRKIMADDILATMKNGVVITREDLAAAKEIFFKKNPRMKSIAMDNPDADPHFLEGIIIEKVIDEYINRQKINETEVYKKTLRDAYEFARHMVNSEFFSQQFNITISETELKDFYDTHQDEIKELPYDTVKDKLRENLHQSKLYELCHQKFEELKKEYGVQVKESYSKINEE